LHQPRHGHGEVDDFACDDFACDDVADGDGFELCTWTCTP
jgi:hypothetical protein